MGLAIPFLPEKVHASALMHGNHSDFVINAYLALQRQWPDEGGFAHYVYTLELGARRADVLREIAHSSNGQQCGVHFVDDLPPDHEFNPDAHDAHQLLETTVALRLARSAADVEQMRQAVARLTAGELAQAVQGLVQAQQAHQALLESRLNELAAELATVRSEIAPQPDQPLSQTQALADAVSPNAAPGLGFVRRYLALRQTALEQQSEDDRSALSELRAEVSDLRAMVQALHGGGSAGSRPPAQAPAPVTATVVATGFATVPVLAVPNTPAMPPASRAHHGGLAHRLQTRHYPRWSANGAELEFVAEPNGTAP